MQPPTLCKPVNLPQSPPVPPPDLRTIAAALGELPELPMLLTPGWPGTAQAIALGELLVAAQELGAFADLSPHGRVAFAGQEHPDGPRFYATWTPNGQHQRITGTPVPFRDMAPPAQPGNPDDDIERTLWILIRARRALAELGALPAVAPQDLSSAVAHLAAWLSSCRETGLDPQAVIAAAWNRHDPQSGPFALSLPPAPFTLLREIFAVLDREPEWSSDEVGQIAELLTLAGWPSHDPGTCDVPQCPHHHHAVEDATP